MDTSRLLGRDVERGLIDSLLDSARAGSSEVLVIRGETGIGKTSLLDYAVNAASDFLVIRLTGFEPERDVGFAALYRLLTPILHQIERLPPPQRDAMNSALGLATGPPSTPFLLGLGTSALAANAARARERMLCVFDDVQWIDRESLAPLAFWARRLRAEGIVVIFGERTESEHSSPLDEFPVLDIGGLDVDAARALLDEAGAVRLDRGLVERIVAETGGNPLALIELAKDLTSDQLVEIGASLQPLPVRRRMEQRFARQVRALPVEAQLLLLLAAADSTGDPSLVFRAANVMGLAPEASGAVEAAGLLEEGSLFRFRHPLIRSAVYSGARAADRRAVHAALASATDADTDPERRAWHLAGAAATADEGVAAVLEQCAARAAARGGHPAAAALLSRAAELTPDPAARAIRRVAAAEAALAAGGPAQAHALVALARPDLVDMPTRARADRVDGCTSLIEGRAAAAAPMLLSAGVALLASDVPLGRRTLLEALDAAFMSGNAPDHPGTLAIAQAAHAAPSGDGSVVDALLDALAMYVTAGYETAVPLLRAAVEVACRDDVPAESLIRWSLLASSITWALWDYDGHVALMTRLQSVSRDGGSLNWMAIALQSRARFELLCGRFEAADAFYGQAAGMYADMHRVSGAVEIVGIHADALRGHDTSTRSAAATVISVAQATGLGVIAAAAHDALVLLEIGRGHYAAALEHAQVMFDRFPISLASTVLADVVEAASRSGDLSCATLAIGDLDRRARASGSPWAMGLLARAQALMDDERGEPSFQSAITLLDSTPLVLEQARTHLLYGEFLRRAGRRVDARRELRLANEMFTAMGATPFATRAADEIRASGERVAKRTVATATQLTPREAHVARLAAAGDTNAEIGAHLFISAHTVEYHLRKVYRKLGVASRRQLKLVLPAKGSEIDV